MIRVISFVTKNIFCFIVIEPPNKLEIRKEEANFVILSWNKVEGLLLVKYFLNFPLLTKKRKKFLETSNIKLIQMHIKRLNIQYNTNLDIKIHNENCCLVLN